MRQVGRLQSSNVDSFDGLDQNIGECMRIIRYLALGLLGVALVVFTLLNAQSVTVNVLFTSVTLPLPLLLCFSLLIGILLGVLLGLAAYWKAKRQYAHRLRQQSITHASHEN